MTKPKGSRVPFVLPRGEVDLGPRDPFAAEDTRIRSDPDGAVAFAISTTRGDATLFADIALCLRDGTDGTRARASLLECFRKRDGAIAWLLRELLGDGLSGWRLELVRSRPGTPTVLTSLWIEGLYKEEVAARGKYGAHKRVAVALDVSIPTVRSVIQRTRKRNRK